jgi:nucleotide-binding universal stress UspA family protein
MPPLKLRRRVFRRKLGVAQVRGALTGLLRARRSTRTFLGDTLGNALPRNRLKLRSGEFYEQIGARAAELGASLIVLSPEANGRRHGRKVTRLARATNTPVLVARETAASEVIVAATDLRSEAVPVLKKAAELSERLGVPMVAVHNLNMDLTSIGPEMAVQLGRSAESKLTNERRQLLSDACQKLSVQSEPLLTNEFDPVAAVLREARSRDADLIIVGTRGRSWLERLLTRSVSAEIVSRARRSVLVTPVTVESPPDTRERKPSAADTATAPPPRTRRSSQPSSSLHS